MRVKVTVTQDDICKGVPMDMHLCPLARALLRAVAPLGFNQVAVGQHWANIGTGSDPLTTVWSAVTVPLTAKAQKFIRAFDRSWTVEPDEFTLIISTPTGS